VKKKFRPSLSFTNLKGGLQLCLGGIELAHLRIHRGLGMEEVGVKGAEGLVVVVQGLVLKLVVVKGLASKKEVI